MRYCHSDEELEPGRLSSYSFPNSDRLKAIMDFYLDPEGTNTTIDRVAVYSTPLEEKCSRAKKVINKTRIGFHVYVWLEVGHRYISLEKDAGEITIQVSKKSNDVLHKSKNKPRTSNPGKIIADMGNIRIRELTDFIVRWDFINEGYNAWKGIHCKRFAKGIFDRVAANKSYDFEEEEQNFKKGTAAVFAGMPLFPSLIAAAAGPVAGFAAAAYAGFGAAYFVYEIIGMASTDSYNSAFQANLTSECSDKPIEEISTPTITVVAIDRRAASY